jgi:hypothetical protein
MSHQPSGTVLYYNSLGWSLHYYMFDSEIYLAPFDSPVAIEDDLLRFGAGNEQRYIVLPGWQSRSEILAAITRAGYSCVPLLETKNRVGQTSFFLYRIIPDL